MIRRVAMLLALTLACSWTVFAAEPGGMPWTEDLRGAMAAAKKDNKPLLVDIWATWCVPCKEMDKTTYKNKEVIEGAAAFVALKLDADTQKSFIDRYQIEAFPTLIFLDSEGREITRLLGLVTAEKLLGAMRVITPGYQDYLKAVAAPKDPAAQESLGRFFLAAGNATAAQDAFKRGLKALTGADATPKAALEIGFAEAQLAAGEVKPAAASFTRWANEATEPAQKARALAGLWRAENLRGRKAEAAAAKTRLQKEFPDLAPDLTK